jgi:hypothetical protein
VPQWDGGVVLFVMSAHHISLDSASQRAHRFWRRSGRCASEPPYASVPEAACTVRVPILLRPRDPAGAVFLRPDGSLLCLESSKPMTLP